MLQLLWKSFKDTVIIMLLTVIIFSIIVIITYGSFYLFGNFGIIPIIFSIMFLLVFNNNYNERM